MAAVEHTVKHYYQPTSSSCGYTALAILLSHYGIMIKPEQLLEKIPQPKDENGQPTGSITAQLVAWCAAEGQKIDFYSFDCEILDLSWASLSKTRLLEKLETVKEVRDVPGLRGKYWSGIYVQAYIDMLTAGAKLNILPHVTTSLLYSLLKTGPVYTNVCANVINNKGRADHPNPQKRLSVPDDIHGTVSTHSIVIYGFDPKGSFLVADPWHGRRIIDVETMLCGITAAQIECDNQCFRIV